MELKILVCSLYSIFTLLLSPKNQEITTLVTVVNIKSELRGSLVIRLFERNDFRPEKKTMPLKELRIPVQNEQSTISLGPVPEGIYFIAIYHDANENQKIDYAFFGRPKEGIGFSGIFDCSNRAVKPKDFNIELNSQNRYVTVPLCYNKNF